MSQTKFNEYLLKSMYCFSYFFFYFFIFTVTQTLTEKCLQKVKLIPVERSTKSQLKKETVQGDHHPVTASEVK